MRARTQFIEDLVKFYGKRAGLSLNEIQLSFFVTSWNSDDFERFFENFSVKTLDLFWQKINQK